MSIDNDQSAEYCEEKSRMSPSGIPTIFYNTRINFRADESESLFRMYSWQDLFSSSSSRFKGFVDSKDQLEQLKWSFEVETRACFVAARTSTDFGNTDINKKPHQLQWLERPDNHFPDHPYIVVNTERYECHHGIDRNRAKKERLKAKIAQQGDDASSKKERTKKLNCPAIITAREIVFFTQYRGSLLTKYRKKQVAKQIKKILNGEDKDSQLQICRKIFVTLPTAHENHLPEQVTETLPVEEYEREMTAIVYCTKYEPFKGTAELDELIENLDESKVTTAVPYMPKGGEVYVYGWDKEDLDSKSSWRCDHHRWRQFGGRTFPNSKPKYFKEFSSIILENNSSSNLFQRITFTPLNTDLNFIIIHYLGDHTLSKVPYRFIPRVKEARRAPFENLRKGKKGQTPKRQKVQSIPLESACEVRETEYKIRETTKPGNDVPAMNHNQQSLHNLSDASKSRILGWLNLKGLALHLNGFIQRLTMIPVTVCICGSKSMMEEFTKICSVESSDRQILWFENSVKVDDYFVTALMFRHLFLEDSPLMPLLFAIHDEKLDSCASEILLHAVTQIPELARLEIPIVCERSVTKSVSTYLPLAKIIHTWDHIIDEMENYEDLINQPGSTESSIVMQQMMHLLESSSPEHFDSLVEAYKRSWSQEWLAYFKEELMPVVKTRSVRWVFEELGIFSHPEGVIIQVCDDYQIVLDGFKSLNCVTVDMLVLAFNYLHNYLISQTRIAQCGISSAFTLKQEFKDTLQEEIEITIPQVSIDPENIVSTIQQQFLNGGSDQSRQLVPREYVPQKFGPISVPNTNFEPKEIVVIETIQGANDVIGAIEVANDQVIETVNLFPQDTF